MKFLIKYILATHWAQIFLFLNFFNLWCQIIGYTKLKMFIYVSINLKVH